jgi:hypothetical protein
MAQSNNTKLLKVALVIFTVVTIIYGLGFLIVPGTMVTLFGSNPVEFAWLRWPGGVLIGLGVSALLVFRKPEKQGIFVFMSALSTLLAGLGVLCSWIMKEYSGPTISIAVPTILLLVTSCLLWWGRQKAKGIL